MIMYGRGEESIAEQLGCSVEEAHEIKQSVYNNFPLLEQFEQNTLDFVKQHGYVTTLWGRKRRLPDMKLQQYELRYIATGEVVPNVVAAPYIRKLEKAWSKKARFDIIENAKKYDDILIKDNSYKISEATRQVVNSIIQGCVGGNTILTTQQYGDKYIQDIVNTTTKIWDGLEWTDGTIVHSGKKQLYKITLEDGSVIECSKDHRFLVQNEDGTTIWKRCECLNIYDNIVDIDTIYNIDKNNIPIED